MLALKRKILQKSAGNYRAEGEERSSYIVETLLTYKDALRRHFKLQQLRTESEFNMKI